MNGLKSGLKDAVYPRLDRQEMGSGSSAVANTYELFPLLVCQMAKLKVRVDIIHVT